MEKEGPLTLFDFRNYRNVQKLMGRGSNFWSIKAADKTLCCAFKN